MEVNEETLAIDLIKSEGPAGNFLASPHTAEYFRSEFFMPKVSDRLNRITWKAKGSMDAHERAHLIAQEILKTHRAKPIDPHIREEIRSMFPGIKVEDLWE